MTEARKEKAKAIAASLKKCADLSHGCSGCIYANQRKQKTGCLWQLLTDAQYMIEDMVLPGTAPISTTVRDHALAQRDELAKWRAMCRTAESYPGNTTALLQDAARWIEEIVRIEEAYTA